MLGYALTEKSYVYHVNPTTEEYYEEINHRLFIITQVKNICLNSILQRKRN